MSKSKFRRIFEIYRKHGLFEVLSRSLGYVSWTIKKKLFLDEYAIVEVNNTNAIFRTETKKEHLRFDSLMGEEDVIADILKRIEPDDTFYDVGSNVGLYSCLIGQELPEGNVVAFEPHPGNADRLKENLEQNDVSSLVYQSALGKESGTAKLLLTESGEVGVGSFHITSDDEGESIDIEIKEGDEIVKKENLPAPTILKVDVEGAEYNVLTGLENILKEHCRLIYCEIHPEQLKNFSATRGDIIEFLTDCGFRIENIKMGDKEEVDILAIKNE